MSRWNPTDYVNCRKNRDAERGNANARTDRAQRNLAEQMLNNPTPTRDRESITNEKGTSSTPACAAFSRRSASPSQREIEKAVRDAIEAGKLKGNEKLPAKMVLTIGGVSLTHEIDGRDRARLSDGLQMATRWSRRPELRPGPPLRATAKTRRPRS